MRILIVEDDADLCAMIQNRLIKEGYETDVCHDGHDAGYYIEHNAYDLILLDRMLPGRSGTEILKYIRDSGIQAHVIITTALSGIGDRIEGLDAGADDYLVKPYDIDELLARVRAVSRRPVKIETESLAEKSVNVDVTINEQNNDENQAGTTCPKCGTQHETIVKFCSKCGTKM